MKINMRRGGLRTPLAGVVALGLAAAVLAGQPAGGATKAESGLALAKRNVAGLYEGSAYRRPPAAAPKPQKGKSVWFITITRATTARWVVGAESAGKALGWRVRVFDGKANPPTFIEGVQQAIANKADGIVFDAIDCAPVKAALTQARRAGIKVVGSQGVDCSLSDPGSQSLFNGTVRYANGDSVKGQVEATGRAQADWVTVKTKGKGRIINVLNLGGVKTAWQNAALKAELTRACPGCRIVDTIGFTFPEIYNGGVRQKLEQSLLKHRDANAVIAPFDDVINITGADAALRSSGRNDTIHVISAGGNSGAIKAIRENKGLDATLAFPFEWDSWAAMATLNRLFHGQKPVVEGIAQTLIDRGHNDKASTYVPPVDFKAAYRKAWRGSKK